MCDKALKIGQKDPTATLKLSKSVLEERSLMITVLIARFSVKIYILLVIYPFPTPWEALDVV